MRRLVLIAVLAASPAVALAQPAEPVAPAATMTATPVSMGPLREKFVRERLERLIACFPFEPYRQAVDGAVMDFGRQLSIPEAQTRQRLNDSTAKGPGGPDRGVAQMDLCNSLGGVWGLAP